MPTLGSGAPITLGRQIARGGEGDILEIPSRPKWVAKIFREDRFKTQADLTTKINKVKAMVSNKPAGRTAQDGHVVLAWPEDVLKENGKTIGFVMPMLDFSEFAVIHNVANASDRLSPSGRIPRWVSKFTWDHLLNSAVNMCAAVAVVHEAGGVVGDFNESNVLVSNTTGVTLVDCDSMQFEAPTKELFHCTVWKPEYSAPEIARMNLRTARRTPESDLFVLAIHIYTLLMDGNHPFQRGHWTGAGERPDKLELMRGGAWAGGANSKFKIHPTMPAISLLPRSLRDLFERALGKGAADPKARPTAEEWRTALFAVKTMRCGKDSNHTYPSTTSTCPWCDLDRRLAHQPAKNSPPVTQQIRRPAVTASAAVPVPASSSTGSLPAVARSTGVASAVATIGAVAPLPPQPAAPLPLPPPQPTPREPLQLGRRIGAGILTMLVFLMAYYSARVLAHIWPIEYMSRSFLKFQEITKETLLQLSPTAVLWAVAVAVFGTRLRGLPWIAVAHAAALGINFAGWIWLSTLRALYPPRPLWRPVFDLLDAIGSWTAWAASLCSVICLVVTSRIAKILPRRSLAAAARSATRWARVRGFLGNFSTTDWRLGRWALVLSLSLIVPWMIGRFIFQDHWWLTTGPGVFDTSARTFWSHAPLLWGAGILVILLALSAAWIFNPKWRGRYIAVISGILIGSIALVGIRPLIHGLWLTAERKTAARLLKTPYPFSDHYYTCGSKSATIDDGLWQVYTTQISGSKTSNCNRLVFYKGWREMGHYDLRRGREVNTSPSIIANKADAASGVVKIKDTKGKTITVVLGKYI